MLEHLEGNLTGSIYSDTRGADDALYAPAGAAVAERAWDGCSTTKCPRAWP